MHCISRTSRTRIQKMSGVQYPYNVVGRKFKAAMVFRKAEVLKETVFPTAVLYSAAMV